MKKYFFLTVVILLASSFAYSKQQINCGDLTGSYGMRLDVYAAKTFFEFMADGLGSFRSPAKVLRADVKTTAFQGKDQEGNKFILQIPTRFLTQEGNFKTTVKHNSGWDFNPLFECTSEKVK